MLLNADELMHVGTPRHSGRYPWGSGDLPQNSTSFLDHVSSLRKQGMSESDIAKGFGMSVIDLRAAKTVALSEKKAAELAQIYRLKEKGMSNGAIAQKLGLKSESVVRSRIASATKIKTDVLKSTSDLLRDHVTKKDYVDVGLGLETQLGISSTRLKSALSILRNEGYEIHKVKVPQMSTDNLTTLTILAKPGVTQKEVWLNRDKIRQINDYSEDGGLTYLGMLPPLSISSKRVAVRYGEDGGGDFDGTMYIRPGVPDVSIGSKRYAQVRVAVDGTHYLKGMAIYKNDLPDGVDILVNTPKKNTGNKLDAFKPMKDDPDNPFGATIKRQLAETDPDGKRRVTSVMNIVSEEGTWDDWAANFSSQMLSKQSTKLAKQRLKEVQDKRKADLDEIMSLTNPVIKRKLLLDYADSVDADAVDLHAASLPRTAQHVLIPVKSMRDAEVYAPNYNDGERVVLIRYPHGGTFEIPELMVNNKNKEAKELLGDAADAIGINGKVAEKLSGADFDGDFVLVIPNEAGEIKTNPTLEGLKGFDPKAAYPKYEGMQVMSEGYKQQQIGVVTNLITDMTIKGAPMEEIARAVRHSMVVIDAAKHELNYKQSYKDNGIANLRARYQTLNDGSIGSSTLISRAGKDTVIKERRLARSNEGGAIDPATGKLRWVETNRAVSGKDGDKKEKVKVVPLLSVVDDAHTLSSGTRMESIYADHSNALKNLANEARKEYVNVKNIPYSPTARKAYAAEVASLDASLRAVLVGKPAERQANIVANTVYRAKLKENPNIPRAERPRLKQQALAAARANLNAKRVKIQISDKEWEAIQAGAITNNKLEDIIKNIDPKRLKELATPREAKTMSASAVSKAKALAKAGYTQAQIAESLGVSVSVVKAQLNGGE